MPTHRKRVSVLRLSSDTTHSLPLYVASNNDDNPPDYPDSAEEADADTDTDDDFSISPPRRRRYTHRRQPTLPSSDPFLDSLLARSVHALEMSNTLLQTSMSTQTALSTIFADSPADDILENSVRGLEMRIEATDKAQPKWADDLAEISRGVDGLFSDAEPLPAVSSSLPTSSSPMKHWHPRRPSESLGSSPHLHLSLQGRDDLVSPPPRAMTQYSTSSDLNSIYLPSTIGARASSSTTSLALSLHAPLSEPQLTDRPVEPATPAYNMLSSFVRPSSASASPASTPRTSPAPLRRTTSRSSKGKSNSRSPAQTRDTTPKQLLTSLPHPHHLRPMTPPTEESSSSSDTCPARLTVLSLRKILDEQPPPPPPPPRLRAPAFLPRTPPPVAEASTSTATASISRLFTKGKHTSSTRAVSPPRQSAMKQPSPLHSPITSTPTPTPPLILLSQSASTSTSALSGPALGIPSLVRNWSGSIGQRSGNTSSAEGSTPSSSGRSTPKRISFAQLPESYAGSRGGSSARFRERDKRRKKGGGGGKGSEKVGGEREEGGWWSGWLGVGMGVSVGGHGNGAYGKGEERVEERMNRGWGGRMPGGAAGFGPGMDEWAI
ncbi:hypothetical protein C0991_006526 [Blastosporella zonata]|nr:hypothetical protein C0991_006526 [Blastosporella zonata]